MRGIFATLRPFQWNAESVAASRRGSVCRDVDTKLLHNLARLADGTLAATWTGPRAFEDRVDQCATQGLVSELIAGLQKTHRAFEVHADWAGRDVRGRRKHTTHRRAVASGRIRVEHKISYSLSAASIRACWRQVASNPARIEFVPMTVIGLPLSPGAGMKPMASPVAWT